MKQSPELLGTLTLMVDKENRKLMRVEGAGKRWNLFLTEQELRFLDSREPSLQNAWLWNRVKDMQPNP